MVPTKPINVLLVESSRTQRELLTGMIRQDQRFAVVGTAGCGRTAIEAAERLRPTVIAMNIYLPGVDAYAATRIIMQHMPTPVVMISADGSDDTQQAAQALAAGALAIVRKPLSAHNHLERADFLTTLQMASAQVLYRWS